MSDIFVYKNNYGKLNVLYSAYGIIVFLVASILFQTTNNLLVLLIFPASFLFAFLFYQTPPNPKTMYKTITVNNEKKQLVFSSEKLDEIFMYKDVDEIISSKEGKVTHLDIKLKSGNIKRMSFFCYEYNLDFLKRIPSTIFVR